MIAVYGDCVDNWPDHVSTIGNTICASSHIKHELQDAAKDTWYIEDCKGLTLKVHAVQHMLQRLAAQDGAALGTELPSR